MELGMQLLKTVSKKTINHINNKEYGKAALSGTADIFDIAGGIGYLKDINLVNGLIDDISFSKKFFRDVKNPSTVEKVYNISRPLFRAVGKPFRDIINPVLYRTMMLNNGDASGKGIINNLLGNSELAYPLIEIKNEKGILNKTKGIFKNYNTSLYNAEHAQNLNDVYGTYLYQNLLWKNPSNLTLNSDPVAKRVFENTKGLSRYSDLPIYTLGFDNPTSLGHGFSSKDKTLKPIIYDTKTGKINFRGTYYKNGTNFRSKKSPTESHFTSTNQDIGGHFIAISKRKDLKGNSYGWPSHFFDVAIKDTQHFTPTDYMKKWKQKNPIKAIPLAIMDIMGDDFNLFGKGVYEVYPSWTDMTPIINYRKDIPTLESSFKENGGKLNLNALEGPLYNKHDSIESFRGSSKIPVMKTGTNWYGDGGDKNGSALDISGKNNFNGKNPFIDKDIFNSQIEKIPLLRDEELPFEHKYYPLSLDYNRPWYNETIDNYGVQKLIAKDKEGKYYGLDPKYEKYINKDGLKLVTKEELIQKRKDIDYIGGTEEEVAVKILNKLPKLQNLVDSLSNVYGVDNNILYERLAQEGLLSRYANIYNVLPAKRQRDGTIEKELFSPNGVNAFYDLGLDTAGEHLEKGHYNMRWTNPELGYDTIEIENEKGELQTSVEVPNIQSGIEILAAHAEYLQNKAKRKKPTSTKTHINNTVNTMYNIGEYHKDVMDSAFVDSKYSVTNWKKLLNK